MRHVLVVDDNRELAENVGELLEDLGIETHISTTATDARALATRVPCDIALVDVRLPDTSGVDLVADLRRTCPTLAHVILMTGNATLDTAIAAVRHGVFAYVQKPFKPADMLGLVERALEQVANAQERRTLAGQLARSEQLYRGVVDTVDSLIVGVDGRDRIQLWNRSAERVLGWRAADVVGRPYASLFASSPTAEHALHTLELTRHGQTLTATDWAVATRDGRERLVRWQFRQLHSGPEGAEQLLAVGTDVTDRLELERRAAEAEALASLGRLTAGLAHEIRNPLNAATLQLELLQRAAQRLDDTHVRTRIDGRVQVVRQELSRLTQLLDEFLDLARPRELTLEPLRLDTLVEQVVVLEEPAAQAAGVALVSETEPDLPRVRGNEAMLQQVLVNLVVNALEALRPVGAGQIVITARRSGRERVELAVRDTGPGIPAEVAGKLFTPFVTSKEAGTGLGLTIVKRIVDRHGGSIHIGPAPERGTLVRIDLQPA